MNDPEPMRMHPKLALLAGLVLGMSPDGMVSPILDRGIRSTRERPTRAELETAYHEATGRRPAGLGRKAMETEIMEALR